MFLITIFLSQPIVLVRVTASKNAPFVDRSRPKTEIQLFAVFIDSKGSLYGQCHKETRDESGELTSVPRVDLLRKIHMVQTLRSADDDTAGFALILGTALIPSLKIKPNGDDRQSLTPRRNGRRLPQ
jgi:hypothetical protein